MRPSTFLKKTGWTRGAFARNKGHVEVSVYSPTAVKFCVLGVLMRCYRGSYYYGDTVSYIRAMDKLQRAVNEGVGVDMHISTWNDLKTTSKAKVISMLKKLGL